MVEMLGDKLMEMTLLLTQLSMLTNLDMVLYKETLIPMLAMEELQVSVI